MNVFPVDFILDQILTCWSGQWQAATLRDRDAGITDTLDAAQVDPAPPAIADVIKQAEERFRRRLVLSDSWQK